MLLWSDKVRGVKRGRYRVFSRYAEVLVDK